MEVVVVVSFTIIGSNIFISKFFNKIIMILLHCCLLWNVHTDWPPSEVYIAIRAYEHIISYIAIYDVEVTLVSLNGTKYIYK